MPTIPVLGSLGVGMSDLAAQFASLDDGAPAALMSVSAYDSSVTAPSVWPSSSSLL